MKKISRYTKYGIALFIAVTLAATATKLQAQSCNQVEILYQSPDCFERDQHDPGGITQGKSCKEIAVCVNQSYTYSSSVTGAGWTFLWTVTGPATVVINPNNTSSTVNIVWPQVGVYTLTLTATDGSGNVFTYCLKVNVKDKPNANFTFAPSVNLCAGSIISFTNTTTFGGGGVAYSWNFGDPPSGANNFSAATNPMHTYNAAGTYTVTLIAYSFTMSGGGAAPNEPPTIKTCCADTITKQVTILPGTVTIECISTVCAGDTATYTAVGCGSPTWGTPIGGTTIGTSGNQITVVWGNGNPQGQLSVNCGGCTAYVTIPIIPTNPIIVGNANPCFGSTTSYTLPSLPGTFYNWTLTNITTSTSYTNLLNAFPDNNTVWINWALAPPGTYQLAINLDNKHICCVSNGLLTINPSQRWTAFPDQTICAGTAANLVAFPGAGTYNWTVLPPNGGVSPTSGTGNTFGPTFNNTGNYTVEVIETANTYCNSGAGNPQQIQITVVTTPTPGTIVGPAVVCAGSSYDYSMSTNAPSGYHYAWSVTPVANTFQPGNLTTTTGNSVTILWATVPGTITVSLQRNGIPACPKTVTLNVVKATVGSISGTLKVCVDGTGTYTLSGGNLPPGEVITWSISPSGQGTITSGQGTSSITVLWHGQPGPGPWGPVTINASTGCGNAVPLPGIMVFPKFTFNINKTGLDICQPFGISLFVTGAPSGSTYLWSPGGQITPSITNITTAGTYSVTVTKGGCSFTKSYTVVDPFAIIPVTCGVGNCNGTATNEQLGVQVIKPLVGSFTYKWYSGTYPSGTLIPGANTANYTTTTHGDFYVIVTYGNCSKYVSFNVKKVCCPDVNNPQITSVVRNTCNSYTFTGTTPNPNGAVITWSFGDGSTATGASGVPITHVYASAGVYCVTFCVGPPTPNPTSCTGNCVSRTVTVPIEAAFIYTLGCNGCLNVSNTSTVITSNPSYVTYLWNFGDGNTSNSQNPGTHCYLIPGTYTVTLTITYNDGIVTCTSTATQTVTYTALAININPSPVCTGVASLFSSSPGGFVTYAWNFGDGFTAFTPSSTHIYNASGSYNVTLTVTDALGNTCTANRIINVLPGFGPCVIQPGYICPGGAATLSTPSVLGYTYLWQQETTPNVFVSAPGVNTNNTYSATTTGFYRVLITAPNGCVCTSNKVEVKAVSKPKAIIAAAPSSKLCGTGNVAFTSVNHLTGYTSDWYANGNYGSLLSSGQSYFAFGISTTTTFNLILTNEYGCKDTCSLVIYVNPIPSQPVIASSPTLCEGVPITLTVTNYTGNITWNTGASSLSITVTAAGLYTATYTDPVTGCSSSNNITINRRPPVGLFPHYCDSIPCTCRDPLGNFTIYAPLPLIGSFTNYNIQWYFNNNPVGTNGPNPTYTPAVSGTYHIVVTDPATGCVDTSKTYTVVVPPCDTCDCTNSSWGEILLNELNAPVSNQINLSCNTNYILNCNTTYTLNAFYNCTNPATCPPNVTYSLQPPSGAPITGNIPPIFNFTPTQTGTYTLTLYGWCGTSICDTCIIDFTVNCPPLCDCAGSHWGEKSYTTQGTSTSFNCNGIYTVGCNQPVTVNATYNCSNPLSCPPAVTYSLQPPIGAPITGNAPVTFTPSQTGTYTLTLFGWCGTAKCDSCVVRFRTVCIDDSLCCPYPVSVDTTVVTYTYNQQFNATIATQNFIINGLAGVPITEVRAEVLSYTITDNYEKDCMKCINLPFTWASVLSAGNIGAVLPRITMYNTTVHPFNPTGPGVYQNPREVVWNSGSNFIINNGTQFGLNFILPPPPRIDCCELSGRICVKFTFRDDECRECEVIACFDFLIVSSN